MQETSLVANIITNIDLAVQRVHRLIRVENNKHNPNRTRVPIDNPKNNKRQDPRQHNRILSN